MYKIVLPLCGVSEEEERKQLLVGPQRSDKDSEEAENKHPLDVKHGDNSVVGMAKLQQKFKYAFTVVKNMALGTVTVRS